MSVSELNPKYFSQEWATGKHAQLHEDFPGQLEVFPFCPIPSATANDVQLGRGLNLDMRVSSLKIWVKMNHRENVLCPDEESTESVS